MNITPEIEGISVVFIGSFNPAIFSPDWFARQELIAEADLKNSEVEVITRELTLMSLGDIKVVAQTDRFQLETTSVDQLPLLRDLALGTLRYLAHTPVDSMGINHHFHFKMSSENDWHAVGDALAPKAIWDGLLDEPGMLGVQVLGKRPLASSKSVRVQVQPSKKTQPGVYLGTNEHFEPTTPGPKALNELLKWLESEWDDAHEFSRKTTTALLQRCLEGES